MKRNFIKMLFAAALLATIFGCSKKDDDKLATPEEDRTEAEVWPIIDGNFLTQEDVIISEDLSTVNISKAYIQNMVDKSLQTRAASNGGSDNIIAGDVLGCYVFGEIYYFKVNSTSDTSKDYLTCNVERIDLDEALEIANIDLGEVSLNTAYYMDESQPKRVNNSGEADANGMINTNAYIEKSSDGQTVYHPIAVAVQAVNPVANADGEKEEIPGAYIGAYIGQAPDVATANGWFSVVKSWAKAVIKPIATAVEAVAAAGDALVKFAVGGQVAKDLTWLDMNLVFDECGKEWPSGDKIKNELVDDESNVWTNEEFKAKIKGKAKIFLDGNIKARYGNEIKLKFSPGKVKYFSVRTYNQFDMDMTLNAQIGLEGTLQKEISLKKFPTYCFTFMIGPLPIVLVGYPELVWSNKAKGEIIAYIAARYKYSYNLDWTDVKIPEGSPNQAHDCYYKPSELSFDKFGVKFDATASTGVYFRNSVTLCGLVGPVLDVGVNIKYKGKADFYKKKGEDFMANSQLAITSNVEAKTGGVFRIPGLETISEWLAEKTTMRCNFLDCTIRTDTIYCPKTSPEKMKELFDFSELDD